jgi:hypothetical protein
MMECIFLLATPGSGSSTMVEVLNRYTNCSMSGENWGEFIQLARFNEALRRTIAQDRSAPHAEAAWRKVYALPAEIFEAERALVLAQLNPGGRASCYGFKEIRYGSGNAMATFARDVAFLATLCARPKVILHTRANLTAVLDARVFQGESAAEMRRWTRDQVQCFDAYASRNASLAPHPGCVPDAGAGSSAVPVFRHLLEDYIEQNENEARLWRFLGRAPPGTNEKITLSSKQDERRDGR